MNPPLTVKNDGVVRTFATTRWSLIFASAGSGVDDAKAKEALSELCRLYWHPIFSYVVRFGYSSQDAEDLTQDFFVRILSGEWLGRADPTRGRFRSLLLTSLQNFLKDATIKRSTQKRGGDIQFIPWDAWVAEAPGRYTVSNQTFAGLPAESLFDAHWAMAIANQALLHLRQECESQGKLRAFEVLRSCLGAERQDISYFTLSQALNVPEATVKSLVHCLRRRYRTFLRKEVARTVADPQDLDDEIRYLCGILATKGFPDVLRT